MLAFGKVSFTITSSSFDSPLCSSITPSLFHYRIENYLFLYHTSHPIVSLLPYGLPLRPELLPGLFLLSYSDLFLVFSGRELTFTFAICYRRSVCLSVVCDVSAPYSAGWNFRQFFFTIRYPRDSSFLMPKFVGGGCPFPLKFAFKVTNSLSNSAISTNIGS